MHVIHVRECRNLIFLPFSLALSSFLTKKKTFLIIFFVICDFRDLKNMIMSKFVNNVNQNCFFFLFANINPKIVSIISLGMIRCARWRHQHRSACCVYAGGFEI